MPKFFFQRGKEDPVNIETISELTVFEDEEVNFFLLGVAGLDVELWIEDLKCITYFEETNKEDKSGKYKWGSSGVEKRPLFTNHWGETELKIHLDNPFSEQPPIQFFFKMHIHSKKISEEQVYYMLEYLEDKQAYICSQDLSITQVVNVNRKGNFDTVRETLALSRKVLEVSKRNLLRFEKKNRFRLSPDYHVSEYNESSEIDEESLVWVTQNLSELKQHHDSDSDCLSLNNRHYGFNSLLVKTRRRDFNLYENKIIIGSLESIKSKLFLLKSRCLDTNKKLKTSVVSQANQNSFQGVIKSFGETSYEKIILTCDEQIKDAISVQSKYYKIFSGLNTFLEEKPKSTMWFSSVPHYKEMFEVITEWYEGFSGKIYKDFYFDTIRSIDQLYEIFCLFKIIDAAHLLGFSSNPTEHISSDSWKMIFEKNGKNFSLLYQPTILKGQGNINNLIYVDGKKINTKYVTPDFLIECEGKYLVLDAKYTTETLAITDRLFDILHKYYIFTSGIAGKNSPVLGVMVLYNLINSGDGNKLKDHICEPYGFMGSKTKFPILGSYSLNADISNDFQNIIVRFIEISANYNDTLKKTADSIFQVNAIKNNTYDNPERVERSSYQVSASNAAIIKAMLVRGDVNQDIAAWFGINSGRVSEIKSGILYPEILAASPENLPPRGPYKSLSDIAETLKNEISILR
ncbi:MAG: hypothetical protein WC666_04965 [Candidatus Paceibacterota bacterium]|jgi:hypothetical protein